MAPSPPTALAGMAVCVDGRCLGSALPDDKAVLKQERRSAPPPSGMTWKICLPIGAVIVVKERILDDSAQARIREGPCAGAVCLYYGSSITQGAQAWPFLVFSDAG